MIKGFSHGIGDGHRRLYPSTPLTCNNECHENEEEKFTGRGIDRCNSIHKMNPVMTI